MDRISKALELARQKQQSSPSPQREKSSEQIRYTQTQTISIPPETLREHRIISGLLNEPIADAYRVLRSRVLRLLKQNGWQTLGVTSATPGEGKTLTSINLGISIAMEPNYSVLLVDTDLRRPRVHHFFGIKPELGLNDYLHSEGSLEDLLIHPSIERFILLPCLKPMKNSSELLATPKMVQLVQQLKARYPSRLVIFDLPPVLVGDDVMAFSPLLDAVLLVVEDGKTRSDELTRTFELLKEVNLLGTVLNKTSEVGHGYYYGY